MSKNKEFRNDLDKIVKIFFLTQESYLVLRELYKTSDNSNYLIDLKFKQSFFTLTKVNYWRVIVLQLCKLYIEKERFNIIKFLNKCMIGGHFVSLNIDQTFILSQLKEIEFKKTILENLKKQRDKIFAHEDENTFDLQNEITLDHTKELIDLCQNVISNIYLEVYDIYYDFETGNSAIENLRKILKSLDERESQRNVEEKKYIEEYIRIANLNK